MSRAPRIIRSVLSDQVKDYLLTAILAGEFPPGSRIIETRVARDLGVSQGPVREALRDLEALGLIESTPYQGARVRRPSKTELLEAYDVRAELESFGARLALRRLSDRDLFQLQHDVDLMRQAARIKDVNEQGRMDVVFHAQIISMAGSRVLERLWRYLEPVSRTHITLVLPGVDAGMIAELHQPILDALRDRDLLSAEAAIRNHFHTVGTLFENLFVEQRGAGLGEEEELARVHLAESATVPEAIPMAAPVLGEPAVRPRSRAAVARSEGSRGGQRRSAGQKAAAGRAASGS